MPLPEALVCPVCCRRFKAKAATLKHISRADETNHRDAMEWQVELAIDARFKGLSCQEASRNAELWFGHDWIARLWKATYGEEATEDRNREMRSKATREYHRLHPGFNGNFPNRHVGCGPDNPFFGKKHTPEARAKMSAKQRGKTISEDQIRKFRENHRRKFPTAEAFGAVVRDRFVKHPEAKDKIREARLRQRFLQSWTRPERIMADLLAETALEFEDHVPIGGLGVVDFLVGQTIVEVYGDYWHANPRIYGDKLHPMNPRQVHQQTRDEAKLKAYRFLGYRVEIFWENDLLHNPDDCRARLGEIARSDHEQLP